MIRTLWFLVKLAAVVYALSWLLRNPGEMILRAGGYELQTSTAFAGIAAAVIFTAVLFLLRFGDWIKSFGMRFERWREKKGLSALTRGFVAIAAGDAPDAMRSAKRAGRYLPKTPLRNLLLAQAEQLRGNRQGAAKYFVALMQDEETSFLGLRGLLNQAIADGKYEHALALARQAHAKQPQSVAIWRNLFLLESRAHNWPRAGELLRKIDRARAWPRAQTADYWAAIWVEEARLCERGGDFRAAHRLYKRAFAAKPDLVPAAAGYVETLFKLSRNFLAERALQRAWAKSPHMDLANLALTYFSANPRKLSSVLRRMQRAHPDHPAISRVMVETAMSQQLWGMAATHAADMMARQPSARNLRLLQRLQQSIPANDARMQQDLQKIIQTFSEMGKTVADPAWICGACNGSHFQWHANCPKCGEFSSQNWGNADDFTPIRLPAI